MNAQLYHIMCYLCYFFFSFLEQNCSAFSIEILITVIKNAFLFSILFLFFLYAKMMLVYVMIEIFRKIQFISFWWLVPFIMFFKIAFNSLWMGISLISSLSNIYLRNIAFDFWNGIQCPSIFTRKTKNIYCVMHLIFKNGINIFHPNIFIACK